MEAKDTVMNNEQIQCLEGRCMLPSTEYDRQVAQAQAKISFDLGYKACEEELGKTYAPTFKDGKKAGIREVVEIYKKENPWMYEKYHTYWERLVEKLCGKPN